MQQQQDSKVTSCGIADVSVITTRWPGCDNSLIKCTEQKQCTGICIKISILYTSKKEKRTNYVRLYIIICDRLTRQTDDPKTRQSDTQ